MPCVSRARCKKPGPGPVGDSHERSIQADETFRDDFTFRNTPEAIRRFPLPFPEDKYMYSVNIEPHTPGPQGLGDEFAFDVDEHYVAECRERALVLAGGAAALPGAAAHDERAVGLPRAHHGVAGARLSAALLARPSRATSGIGSTGPRHPSAIHFGDPTTLPQQPLDYITRQAQGDFVVMDQREGDLWAEAGHGDHAGRLVVDFDVGMTFKEWHGPVPLAHEMGVSTARSSTC
jgi:hypothetical protein